MSVFIMEKSASYYSYSFQFRRRRFLGLVVASCSIGRCDDLVGQASVIDGDTLEIHGTHIRLWGIDAPETTQLCCGDDSLQ
jgi:endonuclease YncB( thermonuclease family)